jgi:hypothetical protein
MKAFKPCPRSGGMRLGGKTTAGVLGVCLFLAGTRAAAQSSLGVSTPAKDDTEPRAATLGAPFAADKREPTCNEPPRGDNQKPLKFPGFSGPPLPQNWARKSALQPVAGVAAQQQAQMAPAPGIPRAGGLSSEGHEPFPPLIRLEVPGNQVLFRLESEEDLRERMRQEAMQREEGKQLYFPDTNIVLGPDQSPPPRTWPQLAEWVEPADVGFRRLWFHQINFDRYGWDLGLFQPAVSAGTFYFDILTLPLQFLVDPCRRYDYNTGWCLPGDPAPLALYPPHPK